MAEPDASPAGPDLPELGEVLVSRDELAQRVGELGRELAGAYAELNPLFVGVLRGAFVFMADLMRAAAIPAEVDFMAVSSYGNTTRTSGVVRIVKDLDLDLAGRHVVLVEDIIDSGLTLSYLRRTLQARNPASLEVVALLVRDDLDPDELGLRWWGFRVPADWVVGYGLDVAQRWRWLPEVRAVRVAGA